MVPVVFEKDDDDNGHIDFITAASVRRSPALFSRQKSFSFVV